MILIHEFSNSLHFQLLHLQKSRVHIITQSISCGYKVCTFDNKVDMPKCLVKSVHVSFTHFDRRNRLDILSRPHQHHHLQKPLKLEGPIGIKTYPRPQNNQND